MHFLLTFSHGSAGSGLYVGMIKDTSPDTKMSHTGNISSRKLFLLYQGQWFEACFPCKLPGESRGWSESSWSSWPRNTNAGAPNTAWHITAPMAHQLPCKSHAFTMGNSLRMLPDHCTQEFSILLWSLPCHMKETCCWELSGLELSPPAGAGLEKTVSQYKCWDFLRHHSSSLPVSCCTQERFNGLEEIPSAYCHRTQKPGPSPKQETENLSCESKRTNWPDYYSIGKAQPLLQLDCGLSALRAVGARQQ